jgi:6-pyruvoyltetrahydropterin/6-carboxytetrahydropterin synthase
MIITATRYHDFSCGHRVAGHENKCAHLHGHNYRVFFTVAGHQDQLGRVLDFSAIKVLANWCEDQWDHKFLAYVDDELMKTLVGAVLDSGALRTRAMLGDSIVWMPFNPTAENMAAYLLRTVGPQLLPPHVQLVRVQVDETRKCSAAAELQPHERKDV